MTKRKNTIAVVVPAHNEANHIGACIESLLNQSIKINKIIVISNNSSDGTSEVVRKYPGVCLIETSRKGLINARDIGFDFARSDILVRINADVVCDQYWAEKILESFFDESVMAVAGVASSISLPVRPYIFTTFWSRIYLYFAEAYFGIPILWGANMALRKTAWELIKSDVCRVDSDVHEDQDISIHLAHHRLRVVLNNKAIVKTVEMSYFGWDKFQHYNDIRKKTKISHQKILSNRTTLRLSLLERTSRYLITSGPSIVFYVVSKLRNIIGII